MGEDSGHRSKNREGAALSSGPHALYSGAAPSELRRQLKTYGGRLTILARCTYELLEEDPGETRQRSLAAVIRCITVAADQANAHFELKKLRDLTKALEADRLERSAMESGVQRANQAPQLPRNRSQEPH